MVFTILAFSFNGVTAQCTPDASACYDSNETDVVLFEITADDVIISQGTFETNFDDLTVYSGAPGSGTSGTIVFGPSDGDLSNTIISTANPGETLIFVSNSDGSVSCASGSQTMLDVFIGTMLPVFGCTDPTAPNYDPAAICDDGTCVPPNDDCAGALPATLNPSGMCTTTIMGTTGGATGATEVATCDFGGDFDVFYSFTAPASGSIVLSEISSAAGLEAAVFDACGGTDAGTGCGVLDGLTVSGLTSGTPYILIVWNDSFEASGPFEICIEEGPSCLDPTALSVTNVTTTSADVTWTAGGASVASTTVWICPDGDLPAGGTCTIMNNAAVSPQTMGGLVSCTAYDAFVQETCTDGSMTDIVGPISFTALPPAPNPAPGCNTTISYPCPGGTASYSANDLQTWTLCPTGGMFAKVEFTYVDIETNGAGCWDHLTISGAGPFPGTTAGGTTTGQICGEGDGDGGVGTGLASGDCFYHPIAGDCITVAFDSDGSVQESGFAFTFSCLNAADAATCAGMANFALPIDLTSFSAKKYGQMNMIEWTTASEINNEYMMVQKSNGTDNWTEVGKIMSEGNTSDTREYALEDRTPYTVSYYRLMSVDLDGSIQYSEVVKVERRADQTGWTATAVPNPAFNDVNINLTNFKSGTVDVILYDLAGRVVKQINRTVDNTNYSFEMSLTDLEGGMYMMNVIGADSQQTLRIVKN